MSDVSHVYEMDDIFMFWMYIAEIMGIKRCSFHPDPFTLGIQIIDPFMASTLLSFPRYRSFNP